MTSQLHEIDTQMIKNLIFDFGGVLMDWDCDYVYEKYFETPEEMAGFYRETDIKTLNLEFDRGLEMEKGLAELAANFPKHAEAIRMWKTEWTKMLRGSFPENVRVALKAKERGQGLFGLTNWSAETFPYAYENYDFFRHFDDIVVSGRVKRIKPDPEIYRLLLNQNGLNPEECVFFDDNPENIEAGAKLGLHCVWVASPSLCLESELRKLGAV